jgi:hypothetical protein
MGNACCWSSSEEKVNPHQVDKSHFEVQRVLGKGGARCCVVVLLCCCGMREANDKSCPQGLGRSTR